MEVTNPLLLTVVNKHGSDKSFIIDSGKQAWK